MAPLVQFYGCVYKHRYSWIFVALSCLLGTALKADLIPTAPVPWYVTSDGTGTHQTSPGTDVFGLDHDGVGDVIVTFDGVGSFRGTGALLPGGQHVLTAAHVVQNGGATPDSGTVTFETPAGDITVGVTTFNVHPSYSGDATEGYDVAVIALNSVVSSSVPRYDIYRGSNDIVPGFDQIKVGYGKSGHGSTGHDGPGVASGTKRAGLNSYDMEGRHMLSDLGGGSNPFGGSLPPQGATSAYDFDSGNLDNDVFHYGPWNEPADLGAGADEVGSAPGDSGGPTFLAANDTKLTLPTGPVNLGTFIVDGVSTQNVTLDKTGNNGTSYLVSYTGDASDSDTTGNFAADVQDYKITGVTSYGFGFTGLPDADPGTNSSWGEVAVDMRVTYYQSWLDNFIPAGYQPLASQTLPLNITDNTAGAKSATISVDNLASTAEFSDTGSNDVIDSITYDATVLDHSQASFQSASDLNSLIIDFGSHLVGANVADIPFDIFNLIQTAGYTADLDLLGITTSGDSGVLSTSLALFSGLAAGNSQTFAASFDTGIVGQYAATYDLTVADESLPGGTTGTPLTLSLQGIVLIPEPATALLIGVGFLALFRRRR